MPTKLGAQTITLQTPLIVIEGTRGGGEQLAAALEVESVNVRRLHWRPDLFAILPGFRSSDAVLATSGFGDMRGCWGLVPLASVRGPAEAIQLQDRAHGLGLKIAVVLKPGYPIREADLETFAQSDLTLCGTLAECDTAVAFADKALALHATRRFRFRAAADARDILAAIAVERRFELVASPTHPPKRIFFWTGLTATQPFNTGIQRVTRGLGHALCELGVEVVPVKWDELAGRIVPLDAAEAAHLERWDGPRAHAPDPLPTSLAGEWLFVPEVVIPARPSGAQIAGFARIAGMKIAAIFYDLLALKMACIYPPESLHAYTAYWQLFAEVDVALPISWTVGADLYGYLHERGLKVPAIVICPLAGDLPGAARQTVARETVGDGTRLRLIAIGTWEPRKNYPRLLRALIEARRLLPNRSIHLTIVGRRAAEFGDLADTINELAAQAGDIDLLDHISDAELLERVNASDATIFGSWEEGFGLPVLESLWCGLPCLCHTGSAMAEVAPGGGTLCVDMLSEPAIARGIVRLASEKGFIDRLRREAVTRPIRNWDEYARDVLAGLARTVVKNVWPVDDSTSDLADRESAVVWSFRLFLGREPDSAEIVESYANASNSIDEIRQRFLHADEFKQGYLDREHAREVRNTLDVARLALDGS